MNVQFFAEFHDGNAFVKQIINGNLKEDPALLTDNVMHDMPMNGLLQLKMLPTNMKILPHLMF